VAATDHDDIEVLHGQQPRPCLGRASASCAQGTAP
jgi:hypothetical protein